MYQIQKRYGDYLSIFEKDISNLRTKKFYQDDDDITNRVRSELGSCLEKFKGIRIWIENMEEDDLGEENVVIIKRQ